MSQYQPSNLATGVFAERAAVWFGWALLASFAVVVLFASLDTQRRSQLEGFAEVTAVGDKAYFKAPDPMKPLTVAVTFHGQALTPVSPPLACWSAGQPDVARGTGRLGRVSDLREFPA